ncbi:MAG: hypothetical protein DMF75_06880 [Acidobacteria bacterium]|nr:MAG: hypothetical protein DMF75_06880 [Acidobacteriota bacterium]
MTHWKNENHDNLIDNRAHLLLVMLRCLRFKTRKKVSSSSCKPKELLYSPPGFAERCNDFA